MFRGLLSWLRSEPEPPAVTFARQTGNVLEWWLIGFGEDGTAVATNPRALEVAMDFFHEQRSVRWAAAHLANVLVGDLVLAWPEDVRNEVLTYILEPENSEKLLTLRATPVPADLLNGFAMDSSGVTAAVRLKLHALVLKSIETPGLSPAAHALFAAIRHLLERAMVALQHENNEEEMRSQVGRLVDETTYALEGDDRSTRQQRHIMAMLEVAMAPNDSGESDAG